MREIGERERTEVQQITPIDKLHERHEKMDWSNSEAVAEHRQDLKEEAEKRLDVRDAGEKEHSSLNAERLKLVDELKEKHGTADYLDDPELQRLDNAIEKQEKQLEGIGAELWDIQQMGIDGSESESDGVDHWEMPDDRLERRHASMDDTNEEEGADEFSVDSAFDDFASDDDISF